MDVINGETNHQFTAQDTSLSGRCFHQLFERQVERTPDVIALSWNDTQFTYQALNARANQIAHFLQSLGVGPEARVGLYMERSPLLLISLLGVFKAGGAYIPLDLAHPEERLRFVVQDTELAIILTQEQFHKQISPYHTALYCLDTDHTPIASCSQENPQSEVRLQNTAYLIYTSGSTGAPKGVWIRHQGVSNLVRATQILGVQATSRVLQFFSFCFDASVFELSLALPRGATLCMVARHEQLPGPDFNRFLQRQAVTVATLTPSVLAALPTSFPTSLCTLISAGEACSAQLVQRWAKTCSFFNAYGPTEATVWSTVAHCDADDDRHPPIGFPIAHTQVYVLDQDQQPVAPGIVGELYIGGAGQAVGYWRRPDLTAERFVPHPFSSEAGERLYRSGDLVRYRADGNIEYVGRTDTQVKLRGFRIELGEIETVLLQHEMVQSAVVMVQQTDTGEKALIAYLIPCEGIKPATADLYRYLQRCLPGYMIPGIQFVEEFPLNSHGKADLQALGAMDSSKSFQHISLVAPQTAVEMEVARLWCSVLEIEQIGRNENFFRLGGHSLFGVQLMEQLYQRFGVELPVTVLFEHPTLERFSQELEWFLENGED